MFVEFGILNFTYAPEGDKYKVAKRWGHIYTVTRKWLQQSVARRGCLNEESYPVQASSSSSGSTLKTGEQLRQGKSIRYSQNASSLTTASDSETILSAQRMDHDQENILPHMYSTFIEAPPTSKRHDSPPKNDSTFDQSVADDSQSEDDDLYLFDCRILLVGFDASRMRTLVDMVRRGGGSRYMSFNEKLTHVVVGNPSENETKEVRNLAALGVIYVVKTAWLEECNREKKEVPVLQRHIAYDILLPKDPVFFNKATATSMAGLKQGKPSASQPMTNTTQENKNPQSEVLVGKGAKEEAIVQSGLSNGIQHIKSSTVFKGKLFRFSSSFPEEQHPEIVQWVNEGGGEVVVDQNENNVHFIVERHGMTPCPRNSVRSTYVSSHWIHSTLKDGYLLDVGSHVLYSPLPCHIPLSGLQGYRFCVSQYDQKERKLLRNLFYVLGVTFIEKLSKKVTHLFCKFADGDKYEAARKWGMQVVTAEWLYECVKQNKVVDLKGFYPKVLTSQDREAGLCSFSQYPSQSIRMTTGDDASRCSSQSQGLSSLKTVSSNGCLEMDQDKRSSSYSKRVKLSENEGLEHAKLSVLFKDNYVDRNKNLAEDNATENTRVSSVPDVGLSSLQTVSSNGCLEMDQDECSSKRVKLSENDGLEHAKLCDSSKDNSVDKNKNYVEDNATENTRDSSVPDVASAIEDLLAQISKIQDQKSQESSGCHENFMSSNTTMLGQRHADPVSDPEPSKHWMNRLLGKKEDNPPVVAAAKEINDGFSETQTDSQVVGYEEDLSGRQMIIDRVRSSNNSMRTTDC